MKLNYMFYFFFTLILTFGCVEQLRPKFSFSIQSISCNETDGSVTVLIKNNGIYTIPPQQWEGKLNEKNIGIVDSQVQSIGAIKEGGNVTVKFFMKNMQDCTDYEFILHAIEIDKIEVATCKTGNCGVRIRII